MLLSSEGLSLSVPNIIMSLSNFDFETQGYHANITLSPSSETQGQLVGAQKSLNWREKNSVAYSRLSDSADEGN